MTENSFFILPPERRSVMGRCAYANYLYIHEHYSKKISIPELARTAFLSERECYRVFQNHFKTGSFERQRYNNYRFLN